MNRKQALGTLSTALAVTAGISLAGATPAAAGGGTDCTSEMGAVTVNGDLTVPEGTVCVLNGTIVTDDVDVESGAVLLLNSAEIGDDVSLAEGVSLHSADSGIGGDVHAREAIGAQLFDTTVGGAITSVSDNPDATGWVFGSNVEVNGSVTMFAPGEFQLQNSVVHGDVRGIGTDYTRLLRTEIKGDLRVLRNDEGAAVCESDIQGDGTFFGNTGAMQIGGSGEVYDCTGTNSWGDDLAISANGGELDVRDNVIGDDLSGHRNDPAPTGGNNTAGGTKSGQFADL